MTINEIYDQTVRPMTPRERLQLATLILNELSGGPGVDQSDEWSDEDMKDFTANTWTAVKD